MAQKLEVLKPRTGGASVVGPPRVLADASLSFSFKLPANFVRPTPSSASSTSALRSLPVVKLPHANVDDTNDETADSKNTAAQRQKQAPHDAWSDSDDDDASWETRDFSSPIETAAATHAVESHGDDDSDNRDDEAAPTAALHALEVGAWDEEDAPDLPDDFPLLLVNLTRLQREHFPPEHGASTERSEDDMRQVCALVKDTLHRHFTQMTEVLFEQKLCFHCTYGTSRSMLASLHAAYPTDVFGLVDYPSAIDGVALSEFLFELTRPSRWKSVEYLKDALRRCSRDLKWKFDVARELDVLAAHESAVYTAEQERLSAEIDDLTRLRDSFKAKLAKMTADSSAPAARTQPQYLLLRKLEDIETRLMSLLDTYLAEPELLEHECDGMFGSANGATAGMNVLDMVVAMVFSRLPRDFAQTLTSEEHFEMLLDHHIHIRRLWKKDFGRLPPRTSAATYTLSSDDEGADKASIGDAEQDAHAMAMALAQQSELDDSDDAFGHYERVDMAMTDTPAAPRRSVPSSASSWESVHALDHDDDDGDDEQRQARDATSRDDHDNGAQSDGYGADYDSNESDDDGKPVRAPVQTVERPRRTRLRRVSPRAAKASAEPVATAAVAESETKDAEAEDAAATAAAKSKKAKSKKKAKKAKDKTKKSKSKKKDDAAPFQPFACTGALAFLRLAKENEMF